MCAKTTVEISSSPSSPRLFRAAGKIAAINNVAFFKVVENAITSWIYFFSLIEKCNSQQ
jgi:hypothetical protein